MHPEPVRRLDSRVRQVVINRPQPVVDAPAERLDPHAGQTHVDALVPGRAFATVGTNEDDAATPLVTVASSSGVHATLNAPARLVASLTGLPPHFLGHATENPAGADGMRSSEPRHTERAERRQRSSGDGREEVMRTIPRPPRANSGATPRLTNLDPRLRRDHRGLLPRANRAPASDRIRSWITAESEPHHRTRSRVHCGDRPAPSAPQPTARPAIRPLAPRRHRPLSTQPTSSPGSDRRPTPRRRGGERAARDCTRSQTR